MQKKDVSFLVVVLLLLAGIVFTSLVAVQETDLFGKAVSQIDENILTVLYPPDNQVFEVEKGQQQQIKINGSYVGLPATCVEASFNGSDFQQIDINEDGNFSGFFVADPDVGNLVVRVCENPELDLSINNISVVSIAPPPEPAKLVSCKIDLSEPNVVVMDYDKPLIIADETAEADKAAGFLFFILGGDPLADDGNITSTAVDETQVTITLENDLPEGAYISYSPDGPDPVLRDAENSLRVNPTVDFEIEYVGEPSPPPEPPAGTVVPIDDDNYEVMIDDSDNIAGTFDSSHDISIKKDNKTRLEFSFNFTDEVLDLEHLDIAGQDEDDDFGYSEIYGLEIGNTTKTVYVDIVADAPYVCIRDTAASTYEDMSDDCDDDSEYLLECPGSEQGYTCSISGDYYKVSGLRHSVVAEFDSGSSSTTTTTTTTSTTTTTLASTSTSTTTTSTSTTTTIQYSCYDSIQNRDESDVDCGGSCPACKDGKSCVIDADCENLCMNTVCSSVPELQSPRQPMSIWIPVLIAVFILAVMTGAVLMFKAQQQPIKKIDDPYLERVHRFVQDGLNHGYTKDQLQEELIQKGWKKDMVEKYFRQL